jgi:hypothetical protein
VGGSLAVWGCALVRAIGNDWRDCAAMKREGSLGWIGWIRKKVGSSPGGRILSGCGVTVARRWCDRCLPGCDPSVVK